MKHLIEYFFNNINESIFDIDDNISDMERRVLENTLFRPSTSLKGFESIYNIVKNDRVKHESDIKYDGSYYIGYVEQSSDYHMIIISPTKDHNWRFVGIRVFKYSKKIELIDDRMDTPTRYMFCLTSRDKRAYFKLPKNFEFLFDSIASRCKYRDGNIIKESIFDDREQMDNVDKTVENNKWFKRFVDPKNIESAINEASKQIKKDGGKFIRGYRNMDNRVPYIRIDLIEPIKYKDWSTLNAHLYINFLIPSDKYGWDTYRIIFDKNDPSGEFVISRCGKMRFTADRLDFSFDTQRYFIVLARCYTMPDNWKGITKLIEDYDFTK